MAGTSEAARQLVHIGVGAVAIALRWLDWPQAAGLAVAAVAFNRLVLPALSPSVFRDGDRERPWTSGIVLYPIAVLGLFLVFRDRLDLAAAAWGILAAGDGVATLAGTHIRSPRLPWNRDKSLAGLVGFIVAASIAAIALLAFVGQTPLSMLLVLTACLAALVAASVETIPIRLNDNVSVPIAAALVLWSSTLFDPSFFAQRLPDMAAGVWMILAANGVVALGGLLARTVTLSGAIVGAAIGVMVALGGGWNAWALLLATFVAAAGSTMAGRARKSASGIAQERGGRRGPGNALANTGLAAWLFGLSAGVADPFLLHLAAVAALVTAGSDTVASEIGKAFGRTTWMLTTLTRVPRGTTGAVSVEGTLAGIVAVAGLGSLAAWWQVLPWSAVPIVTIAATLASLIEGVIGAAFEGEGILNNDVVNFVNSAIGAAIVVALWSTIR